MWNIVFLFTGFIFILLLSVIFFSKDVIASLENKIFKIMIIVNFIEYLFEIPLQIIVRTFGIDHLLVNIFSRLYSISIFLVFTVFTIYTICICINRDKDKDEKLIAKRFKNFNYFMVVYIVLCILTLLVLPFEKYYDGTKMYLYGSLADILRFQMGIYFVIWVIMLIINIKKIFKKKYIPIFVVIVLILINMYLQAMDPSFLIATVVGTIVCYTMFFTIENPDIRLIEYEKREKELAMSANEAKTAFLSSMSHEIRTPLNAIVGLSEDIMSYQDKVPAEVKEDSIDIVNASNTLLEIIGNILDISKIEGGKLELVESDYLPKEEIESLLKIMRTKLEEKDLEFNVYIDPNIPECLYGDRLRIKQIINNFLSNAIKYTEKGSVNFGVRWINNSLEIRVKDTGRGIKKEDMDKLFQKFERLQVEKNSSVQGTGLGLAITKNLIDLMGGTVKVESEEGKGSMFAVIIPQKLGNKDNIVREALSVEERHDVDYSGKKLLVVDDNKLNIKVLRKAIAAFNFEIDECYDGATAIDKINANNYDIILMDIMMPGMGGEEAIGILKQNPDFKIPVIALTADATNGAKERYLACGFVDYLAKPFSRDVIAKKLENILGNTK